MTPMMELDFKRWEDRRRSQEHYFIAWQCLMLSIAIPMAIHVIIGTLFFDQ